MLCHFELLMSARIIISKTYYSSSPSKSLRVLVPGYLLRDSLYVHKTLCVLVVSLQWNVVIIIILLIFFIYRIV